MNDFIDEENLSLSTVEIKFLKYSWERATNTADVGGELIVRLLNDKRSLFRQLLETHYEIPETSLFTVERINLECPRAKEVGEGVVRFMNRLLEPLLRNAPVPEIRKMCMDLGARHYQKRVWFQAENWLCVKNSLLEVILVLGNKHTNAQRAAWTKLIQFIIRNMKRGFLSEALKNDDLTHTAEFSEEI